jgi:hypothetical protein
VRASHCLSQVETILRIEIKIGPDDDHMGISDGHTFQKITCPNSGRMKIPVSGQRRSQKITTH